MAFKIIQLLVAALAFADLSQASTATKGMANAKKTIEDFKNGANPAFARRQAASTPATIKVSKSTTVGIGMLLASTAGLMNGACLSGLVSGAGQVRPTKFVFIRRVSDVLYFVVMVYLRATLVSRQQPLLLEP